MIKIGMMLGDRYEILEKVGTGGMSDVYKAKDQKLNRFVAVKVLKQEFSENTNFVSKFRVEAQAAASLMHPNIVNVYDVGEDAGVHYIVMELVEGITLKKYIEKKARLSVKEAVSIAIQACMGLEAAHNNHIIHRDIKPQNIIISKEGKVKVTDFGIAKAATSNTITSNVMGSVHYTSPEQARGGYSDERSDIYSMGITLFEMLTGRVPFNGDTTVAIAIKQIQEPMPSPRDFVPEIPVSVEQIVLKCTQKSPDRRYQSVGALIEDLKKSLVTPNEDFVKVIDTDSNAATRKVSRDDMSEIRKQSRKSSHTEEIRLKKNSAKSAAQPVKSGKKRRVDFETDLMDEDEEEYESRMERFTTILAVGGAVLIGCIIIFLAGRAIGLFRFPTSSQESGAQMIAVAGMAQEDALKALDGLGLGLEVTVVYEEDADTPEGEVIRSDIEPGTQLSQGDTVTIVVSGETQGGATVPDTLNKSLAEAVSALEAEGFLTERKEGYSETVAEGNVMAQSPEGGTKAERGSTVTITISLGPPENKVAVPDVLGMLPDEAKATMEAVGLVGNVKEVSDDDETMIGKVIGLNYSIGTQVEPGTSIDIYVSTGPAATYMYVENIESPALEDPAYVEGTQCVIVLTTASGTEIYRTAVTSFPYPVNLLNISEPTGVLTLIYTVNTEATTVTDPVTGAVTAVPGASEQRTINRPITFIRNDSGT